MIENDPDLRPHYHKQGMTYVCDGEPSRFTDGWQIMFRCAKRDYDRSTIVEMPTRAAVFRSIHGRDAQPRSLSELGGKSSWNMAYCNLGAAFIDAREDIRAYYHRALAVPQIKFRCGTPVDQIQLVNGRAKGVVMEDGTTVTADQVIVAAGAWSNKLVDLEGRQTSIGHEVVWFKVTPEEEARWKGMSITTNESTGLNIFPPYKGEVKVLRRSPGYQNTITVSYPENPSRKVDISYPRTTVGHPTDVIPEDAEKAIRRDLREIMPPLAERPFDRTKICWYVCTGSHVWPLTDEKTGSAPLRRPTSSSRLILKSRASTSQQAARRMRGSSCRSLVTASSTLCRARCLRSWWKNGPLTSSPGARIRLPPGWTVLRRSCETLCVLVCDESAWVILRVMSALRGKTWEIWWIND